MLFLIIFCAQRFFHKGIFYANNVNETDGGHMPRRTRDWLNRTCYHITYRCLNRSCYQITHRCLNREFYFDDPVTRQTYLKKLCEMTKRFKVDVLNYTVTCNHVHLLLYATKRTEIANGMQYLQGRMAQRYNVFSSREGAFWSGRYHATLVESGNHLSNVFST